MKNYIMLLLLLLVALAATAQQTTVTATVVDPNGQPYANCKYSVDFVGQNTTPGHADYKYGGSPFQRLRSGLSCDAFGTLTTVLPPNSLISPTPSQWKFHICSADGYVAGPYCFDALITVAISSTPQDISGTIAPLVPPLPTFNATMLRGISVNLENPTVGDSGKFQYEIPQATLIQRVYCDTTGTGVATVNLDLRAEGSPNIPGTHILVASLNCSPTGASTTNFVSPVLGTQQLLAATVEAVTGAPEIVRVHAIITEAVSVAIPGNVGLANHGACWKTASTQGHCTTALDSSGVCTCQ